MTQHEIINEMYKDKVLWAMAARFGKSLKEDLFHYLMEVILSREEKINQIDFERNKLRTFSYVVMYRACTSPRSPFRKQHTQQALSLGDLNHDIVSDDLVFPEKIKEIWDSCVPVNEDAPGWYEYHLFELVKKEGSITKVSKETQIPFRSIAHAIKKYKEKVIARL